MSSNEESDKIDDANYATFRDCLFDVVAAQYTRTSKSNSRRRQGHRKEKSIRPGSTGIDREPAQDANMQIDPSELADFSDYVAGEIFPSLPDSLRNLSHQTLQSDPDLAEKWSLPLSLSTFEDLADTIPPSVSDSLVAYGLVEPPKSDVQSFISPVISSYVGAVTVPPPKWAATRVTVCEICERDWVPMTYHHLIPREVHAKVLKRGWHEEEMLNSVAWLCRACHSFVHKMASNEELAKEFYTIERICERDDVQKWAQWVGTVRWKKR